MSDQTTVQDLLGAVIEQQGAFDAAGVALVIWGTDGQVICQYSGVQIGITDICRLLLSGTVELTRRLDESAAPDTSPIAPTIELVE